MNSQGFSWPPPLSNSCLEGADQVPSNPLPAAPPPYHGLDLEDVIGAPIPGQAAQPKATHGLVQTAGQPSPANILPNSMAAQLSSGLNEAPYLTTYPQESALPVLMALPPMASNPAAEPGGILPSGNDASLRALLPNKLQSLLQQQLLESTLQQQQLKLQLAAKHSEQPVDKPVPMKQPLNQLQGLEIAVQNFAGSSSEAQSTEREPDINWQNALPHLPIRQQQATKGSLDEVALLRAVQAAMAPACPELHPALQQVSGLLFGMAPNHLVDQIKEEAQLNDSDGANGGSNSSSNQSTAAHQQSLAAVPVPGAATAAAAGGGLHSRPAIQDVTDGSNSNSNVSKRATPYQLPSAALEGSGSGSAPTAAGSGGGSGSGSAQEGVDGTAHTKLLRAVTGQEPKEQSPPTSDSAEHAGVLGQAARPGVWHAAAFGGAANASALLQAHDPMQVEPAPRAGAPTHHHHHHHHLSHSHHLSTAKLPSAGTATAATLAAAAAGLLPRHAAPAAPEPMEQQAETVSLPTGPAAAVLAPHGTKRSQHHPHYHSTAPQQTADVGVRGGSEDEDATQELPGLLPAAATAAAGAAAVAVAAELLQRASYHSRVNHLPSHPDFLGDHAAENDHHGSDPGHAGATAASADDNDADRRSLSNGSSQVEGGDHTQRLNKKPRLVWTPELHHRFMNAVQHLGVNNAVPKTILQLMNVQGMTRENVASHLQKYRLYLKRIAGLSAAAPIPQGVLEQVHDQAMREHNLKQAALQSQTPLNLVGMQMPYELRGYNLMAPSGPTPAAGGGGLMSQPSGNLSGMAASQMQQMLMMQQYAQLNAMAQQQQQQQQQQAQQQQNQQAQQQQQQMMMLAMMQAAGMSQQQMPGSYFSFLSNGGSQNNMAPGGPYGMMSGNALGGNMGAMGNAAFMQFPNNMQQQQSMQSLQSMQQQPQQAMQNMQQAQQQQQAMQGMQQAQQQQAMQGMQQAQQQQAMQGMQQAQQQQAMQGMQQAQQQQPMQFIQAMQQQLMQQQQQQQGMQAFQQQQAMQQQQQTMQAMQQMPMQGYGVYTLSAFSPRSSYPGGNGQHSQ